MNEIINPVCLDEKQSPEIKARTCDDFITAYVDFATKTLGSSKIFHEAIGLTILSIIAGRQLCIPFSFEPVFPNIYTILLAPSGHFKSTAIKKGMGLLRKVVPERILPDHFSPEKLVSLLSERSTRILCKDEISGLLLDMKTKQYLGGLKEIFNTLFDSPLILERALRSEKDIIRAENIFFSLIGATTPKKLQDSITPIDIASGFLARFSFIIQETRIPAQPITYLKEDDMATENALLDSLQWIKISIEEHVGQDGLIQAKFENLNSYNTWVDEIRKKQNDEDTEEINDFCPRWIISAAKYALLYELSSTKELQNPLLISNKSLYRSLVFMKEVIKGTRRTFKDFWVPKNYQEQVKLLSYIRKYSNCSRREVLRHFHWNVKTLDEHTNNLKESGLISIEKNGMTLKYKPISPDIVDLMDSCKCSEEQAENFQEQLTYADEEASRLKELKKQGNL